MASKNTEKDYVVVGTYKARQLAWMEKSGVYNYPVRDGDGLCEADCAKVTELWLYAGAKGARHAFAAEFAGKMPRAEFLASHPSYPKGKSKNAAYWVFKVSKLGACPANENQTVMVRVADFKLCFAAVKADLDRYFAGGAFAPLSKLLPPDLAQVPRERLRVREKLAQGELFEEKGDGVDKNVPFPPPENPRFTFVDLFAGIGGFHLAMHELGGKCVFASEWDKDAQKTYAENFGIVPQGDIRKIDEKDIPPHDVLCAGFPCQAFSKAGKQLGFADETKGTLFFDVERILRHHKTKYIILENVRNLVAHDNGNTWRTIRNHLVKLGYRLTPEPLIVSPHHFGIPQLRERVVVLGVYDPANAGKGLNVQLPKPKDKSELRLTDILERDNHDAEYRLTREETHVIDVWDDFYHGINEKVIGFPIWADWFKKPPTDDLPDWKAAFVKKNNELYANNKTFIDNWLARNDNLEGFTPTMRKMEWQCGETVDSAWNAFLQMRPSGLRIKRPDCAPALVAIVQVPIIGRYRRRMTVREAARLQSFDDRFIPNPIKHEAYKQFGNAVNVRVIKECAERLFEHE